MIELTIIHYFSMENLVIVFLIFLSGNVEIRSI